MKKKHYQPCFNFADIKIIDHQTCYQGYFKINKYALTHKLYSGGDSNIFEREVFVRNPTVALLPYDPVLDQVILIEQFRIGAVDKKNSTSPWLLEVVAGIIEKNESPEQVAVREAKEEAGLEIEALFPIQNYWVSPGASTENTQLFCGKVAGNYHEGFFGLQEEHEDIRVIIMKIKDVWQLLKKGEIKNAHTLIALQWLKINHKTIKKQFLEKND